MSFSQQLEPVFKSSLDTQLCTSMMSCHIANISRTLIHLCSRLNFSPIYKKPEGKRGLTLNLGRLHFLNITITLYYWSKFVQYYNNNKQILDTFNIECASGEWVVNMSQLFGEVKDDLVG